MMVLNNFVVGYKRWRNTWNCFESEKLSKAANG